MKVYRVYEQSQHDQFTVAAFAKKRLAKEQVRECRSSYPHRSFEYEVLVLANEVRSTGPGYIPPHFGPLNLKGYSSD